MKVNEIPCLDRDNYFIHSNEVMDKISSLRIVRESIVVEYFHHDFKDTNGWIGVYIYHEKTNQFYKLCSQKDSTHMGLLNMEKDEDQPIFYDEYCKHSIEHSSDFFHVIVEQELHNKLVNLLIDIKVVDAI